MEAMFCVCFGRKECKGMAQCQPTAKKGIRIIRTCVFLYHWNQANGKGKDKGNSFWKYDIGGEANGPDSLVCTYVIDIDMAR